MHNPYPISSHFLPGSFCVVLYPFSPRFAPLSASRSQFFLCFSPLSRDERTPVCPAPFLFLVFLENGFPSTPQLPCRPLVGPSLCDLPLAGLVWGERRPRPLAEAKRRWYRTASGRPHPHPSALGEHLDYLRRHESPLGFLWLGALCRKLMARRYTDRQTHKASLPCTEPPDALSIVSLDCAYPCFLARSFYFRAGTYGNQCRLWRLPAMLNGLVRCRFFVLHICLFYRRYSGVVYAIAAVSVRAIIHSANSFFAGTYVLACVAAEQNCAICKSCVVNRAANVDARFRSQVALALNNVVSRNCKLLRLMAA